MTITRIVSYALPVFIVVVAAGIRKLSRVGTREPGLPPGPPTQKVLGNLKVFPREQAHLKFTEWSRIYGPIISLKMGPGTIIVISGLEEIRELMDKRSLVTADRPATYMGHLIANGMSMSMLSHGERWKTLRRASTAALNPQASDAQIPIQKAEAIQLLYDIMNGPDMFYNHIHRAADSVIFSVLFGKRCPRYESKETVDFRRIRHLSGVIFSPGAQPPVDLVPILRYVPERWAKWKTLCREVREAAGELHYGLLDETEARMRAGKGNGCFMEELLENQEQYGLTREMVGALGGVMLIGGSDTTAFFLQWLIATLVTFPDVQRRAQEEIDRVVAPGHLPTADDYEKLPYIQALIKEMHRFRPVTPLSLPHAAAEDINYNGLVIPKGAGIFVNLWAIYHNPDLFEDPEEFKPERFLKTELGTIPGVDVDGLKATLPFGNGRRLCPGIRVANNSLMFNVTYFLWAFTFSASAKQTEPFKYKKGLAAGPEPYTCTITPRPGRKEVVEKELLEAIETFKKFEEGITKDDAEFLANARAAIRVRP